MQPPIVQVHDGIHVVRDDLLSGGTKRRVLDRIINDDATEIVYASPAYGGAQIAIAHTARERGIKSAIFTAKRAVLHPRTLEAEAAGAKIVQVPQGYLSVVQARAREYSHLHGGQLLPFGLNTPEIVQALGGWFGEVYNNYGPFGEVWVAAGSGTLIRGFQSALLKGDTRPDYHAVQVGHALTPEDVGGATIHVHPRKFEQDAKTKPPFPSCSNYDAKAWEMCREHSRGRVLFWNVMG